MVKIGREVNITPAHVRLNSFVRATRNRILDEKTSKVAQKRFNRARHETKKASSRKYSIET